MSRFVEADRDTLYLLPPSVQEWLPEDHLARFVVEIVDQLNLSELERAYAGRGIAAFAPSMLVALLFYGYATGVFSSRKLERATYDSVAFRFVAANLHPDHDTIATFRKRFLPQLRGLFVQILMLARTLKLLKVGNVSLDGSKVKANASKHKALSYGHAKRIEAQLQVEVEQLLKLAQKADQADLPDGMDIPAELLRRETRLAAIRAAKVQIEAQAQERLMEERRLFDAKMAVRRDKEQRSGKKPGGKPPSAPTAGPKDSDQVNLTDGQSRIMKVAGGFEQAYNAQTLVDTETMLVVGSHVTQSGVDVTQVTAALAVLQALPDALGQPLRLIADAGYFSADNVKACEGQGIEPLIALRRECHHRPLLERFTEPPPLAEGASAVERMRHRLSSTDGKRWYSRRKCTVEPVFGIIKSVLGFRHFMLRGAAHAHDEWNLVCIAWNLKRMHKMLAC